MKKLSKKALSLLLAGTMLAGVLGGCTPAAPKTTGTPAPNATDKPSTGATYPITPEELGSGTPKWTEEVTKDGWAQVTNEGGTTLGYSPDSGIKLIQVDGLAFKDLNKNDQLDGYEDWRQDDDARIADIAAQLTAEDVAGLMLYSGHQFEVSAELNDAQKTFLDMGLRAVLNAASASRTDVQAQWANAMQAYAEGMGLGIPVNISTDPRDTGVSKWPGNLALAATFDPVLAQEQAKQLSKEYRAMGIGTLLGPQIDLASDPRWPRISGTFGEDPALSRDMTNASASGYQSTYDETGKDLGWGTESVNAMIKHWPGDGSAESGRESHNFYGQYNIYPGDQFDTQLIPFVDGGLTLDSATGITSAVMTSYSIAYGEDEAYGELVGTAFSDYKMSLLRETYGFDGVVCTDWRVVNDGQGATGWGVQELTSGERCYKAIMVGVDQFGGLNDPTPVMEAYDLGVDELGEDVILARFQESGGRLLKNYFHVGLFDNPYVSIANTKKVVGSDEAQAAGYDAQLKSIVMLKNDGAIAAATGTEKPTVYVPLTYTPSSTEWGTTSPATAALAVDLKKANDNYFTVVTDTLRDPLTGPADADGKPTVAPDDIIRATKEELAACDYALVFANSPDNNFYAGGYDAATESYIPISLQYGLYTADTPGVRGKSIAGPMVEKTVESVYGTQKVMEMQDCNYYGKSTQVINPTDLDMILSAAENMPESAKVIVAINAITPMVFTEFEDKVDGILMGFGVDNSVFLDIVSGKVEPSGLLPLQMPANMDTVEANYEDVPRDLECHVDALGNTYDFAYGMNWSGVISDARTAKYNVEPLTAPTTQPVE